MNKAVAKAIDGLKESGPKAGDGGKLPQDYKVEINGKPTVLYMSADQGPFQCGHCEYFHAPSSCELVAGTVEEGGCCSLYEPK